MGDADYFLRHDSSRCTRTTAKGVRCRSGRILWPREIPLPDPQCCISHLTGAERIAWQADKPRVSLVETLPFYRRAKRAPGRRRQAGPWQERVSHPH